MKKKIVTKPFDRSKIPPKQNLLAMPFIWGLSWFITRKSKLRINKVKMKGLKPPYIVLGTHHAFMDFLVTPLALFPHRANYVSELEGFEYYGEWKYRQIGCLGTRKFVNDLMLIKNIKAVVDRKGILVLYPEARYCNVGTTALIPDSVGKLVKMLNVPVVTLNMRGNYLQSPIWNLTKRKEAILDATITQIFTREELKETPLEEVNKKIKEFLTYDEYEWQYKTKMAITYEKRAEGLEMPLYKCPKCKSEFTMKTEKSNIYCDECNSKWHLSKYGVLEGSGVFTKIPDWYEWERKEVIDEINNDKYNLDIRVKIESLPNAVNFINLGEGRLQHNKSGFLLTFKDYGEDKEKTMKFPAKEMISVHTEYDYRGKGQCITLSTVDNTYFIYPLEEGFNATKIQFATEELGN